MVKVKSGKILHVSADRKSDAIMQNMSVNVEVKEAHFKGDDVTLEYEYTFQYEPNFATIHVKGEIVLDTNKDERKAFEDVWKKSRQMPVNVAEEVLSALSYTATTVGTLMAYAINVPAPINLPRVNLQQAVAASGPAGGKSKAA